MKLPLQGPLCLIEREVTSLIEMGWESLQDSCSEVVCELFVAEEEEGVLTFSLFFGLQRTLRTALWWHQCGSP